jgi:hypothetical protein
MACDSASGIESRLRTFLRKSASRRFDWIECNCGFWVCEWISLITGADPVKEFRRRFASAVGFQRHVRRAGGNESFARNVAERAGLVEIQVPELGDVGLVVTGDGATMAIKCAGRNWACKTLHGIAIAPFEQIIAWRL